MEREAAIVRRIFDMALKGKSVLDMAKTLNGEGIPSPYGKMWQKTQIHRVLNNEAYTGTLIWGAGSRDGTPPVRVEEAFPGIVSGEEFQRVAQFMAAKAPNQYHPRRAGSPYLLSGLAKCGECGKALTAAEAKSGKYTYYVCQSLIKRGSGTCTTPRLRSTSFERLIIDQLRENILTENNIRDLVKLVAEEMDGVAAEERRRLESIEDEIVEVRRRLDRIWHVIETTDMEVSDATSRIWEHRECLEKLEVAAENARSVLSERRAVLDNVDIIAAYAMDMSEFLMNSEITECRAFIRTFVREIAVNPGEAVIHYTIPTPKDSPLKGGDAADVALRGPVMSTVPPSGAEGSRTPDLLRAKEALSHLSYSPTADTSI